MNVDLCLRVCREVFADKPWILLEHGTILVAATVDVSDADILLSMKGVDELIGPHGGEGSPLGDCMPLRLRAFDGWLVEFAIPIHTFVGDDEVEEAERLPGSATEVMRRDGEDATTRARELAVALFGRHKRNRDVHDPKIIARSDPKGIP